MTDHLHPRSRLFDRQASLYTDKYELTMAEAYFKEDVHEAPACFDYSFRSNPFDSGFVVFAGLRDVLDVLADYRFDEDDIAFLANDGFDEKFLRYLKEFRFRGSVRSMREGEIVFPVEPVLRVTGTLLETQIVETMILDILNFQSLVATKAARMRLVAGERGLSDFGLRRAHGLGGISASRAAVIGGFDTTSNMLAAERYGLTAAGTMAHSFIQSYDDELEAFRAFARSHPDSCILLVDTYDTLRSGIPNAIRVAKEMEERGDRLGGIRLDSGDLAWLARRARKMLDDEGLDYVKIAASNQLDEHVIRSLLQQDAPIDLFGVGTSLVTGDPDGALDGVYKLSAAHGEPRLKISETRAKITLPGHKTVLRYSNGRNMFEGDAVVLESEHSDNSSSAEHPRALASSPIDEMEHPFEEEKHKSLEAYSCADLHGEVMRDGEIGGEEFTIEDIAEYAHSRLAQLPMEYKRFENPHIYKVGISRELADLRAKLVEQHQENIS